MNAKDFRDYYKVLGVPRTATADEIKAAYRRAARRHHPDVSQATDASARMAEVNEAHEVLSDPDKRNVYDVTGTRHGASDGFQPHGAQAADFFSSIFGRHAGRSSGRAGGRAAGSGKPGTQGFAAGESPFRGSDLEASVEISLAEAYQGTTRTITLRNRPSPNAAAVGASARASTRTLEVRIPKGVRHGQRMRLAGQGAPSLSGGTPGDLHLEVRITEDPRIRIDGRDVTQKLPVTPWEAALGATIEAPTLAGRVELTIPPGSQAGRRLRLRGKGLPGAEPGDLYLELDVVLPPAQTDGARKLYEQMAREMAFDPRAGTA